MVIVVYLLHLRFSETRTDPVLQLSSFGCINFPLFSFGAELEEAVTSLCFAASRFVLTSITCSTEHLFYLFFSELSICFVLFFLLMDSQSSSEFILSYIN